MAFFREKAGFRILEHPADMGIEAYGANLGEAFEQAAMALTSIILDPSNIEHRESRIIELSASDHEHLLVKWLADVLYLYDGQDFVGKRFEIRDLSPSHMRAEIFGEPFDPKKHKTRMDVKAITYHQILVEETPAGGRVRVYLDI
jgi:SHS2 domain-containing protein